MCIGPPRLSAPEEDTCLRYGDCEFAEISYLYAESDSRVSRANWYGMLGPNTNFDSLLVDRLPRIEQTENSANDCDCKGDGLDDGHATIGLSY